MGSLTVNLVYYLLPCPPPPHPLELVGMVAAPAPVVFIIAIQNIIISLSSCNLLYNVLSGAVAVTQSQ